MIQSGHAVFREDQVGGQDSFVVGPHVNQKLSRCGPSYLRRRLRERELVPVLQAFEARLPRLKEAFREILDRGETIAPNLLPYLREVAG